MAKTLDTPKPPRSPFTLLHTDTAKLARRLSTIEDVEEGRTPDLMQAVFGTAREVRAVADIEEDADGRRTERLKQRLARETELRDQIEGYLKSVSPELIRLADDRLTTKVIGALLDHNLIFSDTMLEGDPGLQGNIDSLAGTHRLLNPETAPTRPATPQEILQAKVATLRAEGITLGNYLTEPDQQAYLERRLLLAIAILFSENKEAVPPRIQMRLSGEERNELAALTTRFGEIDEGLVDPEATLAGTFERKGAHPRMAGRRAEATMAEVGKIVAKFGAPGEEAPINYGTLLGEDFDPSQLTQLLFALEEGKIPV